MDNLSDIIPFLIIVGSIIYSIVKGVGKKAKEDTAKTTLPGKTSTENYEYEKEVVYTLPKSTPKEKSIVPSVKPVKRQEKSPLSVSQSKKENVPFVSPPMVDNDEIDSILNISDVDEIKKAIIYSEIFNRSV
jgi:hypothetical protein